MEEKVTVSSQEASSVRMILDRNISTKDNSNGSVYGPFLSKILPIMSQKDILTCSLLIVMAYFIFSQTLSYGFFLDDYHFIRPTPIREVLHAFAGGWDVLNIEPQFYRPIPVLFYSVSFAVFGYNAVMHHVSSIMLQGINMILLYFLVRWWGYERLTSTLAAVVFSILAYNHHAVAFISNRQTALFTMLTLASLLCFSSFLRNHNRRNVYYLSLVFMGMAFLSYEAAVMLPMIFILVAWFKRCDQLSALRGKLVVPFILLAGYLFVRFALLSGLAFSPLESPSIIHTLMATGLDIGTNFVVGTIYILFPALLSPRLLDLALNGACLAILGFWAIRKRKGEDTQPTLRLTIGFAIGWQILALLPFFTKTYPRTMYFPSIGFALVVAVGCREAIVRLRHAPALRNRVGAAVLGSLLLLFIVNNLLVSLERQRDYHPFSARTLAWDCLVHNEWSNKLGVAQRNRLANKLRLAGFLDETTGRACPDGTPAANQSPLMLDYFHRLVEKVRDEVDILEPHRSGRSAVLPAYLEAGARAG